MLPLAILSLVLYKSILGLLFYVRRIDLAPEIALPQTQAQLATSIPSGNGGFHKVDPDVIDYEELRWRLRSFVQGRLQFVHALLIAAPLLGLLGTVMGMLHTFHGLSMAAGAETARTVADGVSRALITTQTGLMIAIPGLFISMWIRRYLKKVERRILDRKVLSVKLRNEASAHA